MALRISELGVASPLTGTEISELVQGGVNKQITKATEKAYFQAGAWAVTGTTTLTGNVDIDVSVGTLNFIGLNTGIVEFNSLAGFNVYETNGGGITLQSTEIVQLVTINGSNTSSIYTGAGQASVAANDGGDNAVAIGLTPSSILIETSGTNVIPFAGLQYDADYSTNYTPRSLVDKAYVDSVAGGGASWSLATGGTLIGNNTITLAGFNVTFAGTGKVTFSPSATLSGFNFGSVAGIPSGLSNGDAWYNSTVNTIGVRVNGSTGFLMWQQGTTLNAIPYYSSVNGFYNLSANLIFDGTALLVGGGTVTANTRVDIRGISGGNALRVANDTNSVVLFNVTNTGIATFSNSTSISGSNNAMSVGGTFTSANSYAFVHSGGLSPTGAGITASFATTGASTPTTGVGAIAVSFLSNKTFSLSGTYDHIGFDHNPGNPANILGNHIAFRSTSGAVVFGSTSSDLAASGGKRVVFNATTNAYIDLSNSSNERANIVLSTDFINGATAGRTLSYIAFTNYTATNKWNHAFNASNGEGGFGSGITRHFGTPSNGVSLLNTGAASFEYRWLSGELSANLTGGTTTLIGYNWSPTLTGTTGLTHLAWRNTSGQVLINGTTVTASTSLDVRGISGGTTLRLASDANVNVWNYSNAGIVSHVNSTLNAGVTHTIALNDDSNNTRNLVLENTNTAANALAGVTFSTNTGTNQAAAYLNTTAGGAQFNWFTSATGGINLIASNASASLNFRVGGFSNTGYSISGNRNHTWSQSVITSGSPTAYTFNAGAHTTLAAGVEVTDVSFNLERNVQFGTGALTNQRAFRVQTPTYSFVAASVISTAIGFEIKYPPRAGANATITDTIGLYVGVINVANGGSVGTSYGAVINASTGATNNYAAGFGGGNTLFADSTTDYASIRLPHGAVPTTPVNGDIWTTTAGAFARINGVTVSLGGAGGSGDVVGPASAVDNAIARFDNTTGKLIQNTPASISDTGDFVLGTASLAGAVRYIDAASSATSAILQLRGQGIGGSVILAHGEGNNSYILGQQYHSMAVIMPSTNTVHIALDVERQTSGTAAVGIGTAFALSTETSPGVSFRGTIFESIATAVGVGIESFDLVIKIVAGGAAAVESFRITSQHNVSMFGDVNPNFQSMVGGAFLNGATTNPTGNPVDGAFFYSDASDSYKPKWRVPGGTTYDLSALGSGSFSRNISNISSNTTAGASATTDYVYRCTSTFTLTLPTAVGNTNRYTIKNVGTGVITVNTTSSQTIDGALTLLLNLTNNSIDVVSDGTNWIII